MKALVIYDSRFGNTERIAEAIGRGVGTVSDVKVASTGDVLAAGAPAEGVDLLLVGGPTHNHGPSKGLRAFLDALPTGLRGVPAACFDTRYRGPVLLMGSAAAGAAKALAKDRTEPVAAPESFFIVRRGPMETQQLEPGEVERAQQWGHDVATAAVAALPLQDRTAVAAG